MSSSATGGQYDPDAIQQVPTDDIHVPTLKEEAVGLLNETREQ